MLDSYRPHMLPKVRSDDFMAAASGMPCTARVASFLPGHKCSGRDTTVGCHLPVGGKGTSTKVTDLAIVFGCSACHAIIDGVDHVAAEYIREHYPAAYIERLLGALVETHALLLMEGLLVVPGAKIITS